MNTDETQMDLTVGKTCAYAGCGKAARFMPYLKVWAKGYSRETTDPMKVEIAIPLCDEHREEFQPKDIPSLNELLQSVCRKLNLAAPDTEHVQVAWQPIPDNYKSPA